MTPSKAKNDRFLTTVPDGARHRFIIDRGTHSLRSNKTYRTKADAMGAARKAASGLVFDLQSYVTRAERAAASKLGVPQIPKK